MKTEEDLTASNTVDTGCFDPFAAGPLQMDDDTPAPADGDGVSSESNSGSLVNAANALTCLLDKPTSSGAGDGSQDARAASPSDSHASNDSAPKKKDKNLDNDVPMTFPQRLMEILSCEENSEIISWLPHGRGFIIYQKKKFASDVLPKFFKQSKFTSFTRKLNRWGFTRITRGPETGAYYHKFFQRGNFRLCMQMCCQSVKPSSDAADSPQIGAVGMGNPMSLLMSNFQLGMGGGAAGPAGASAGPAGAAASGVPPNMRNMMNVKNQLRNLQLLQQQRQGLGPAGPNQAANTLQNRQNLLRLQQLQHRQRQLQQQRQKQQQLAMIQRAMAGLNGIGDGSPAPVQQGLPDAPQSFNGNNEMMNSPTPQSFGGFPEDQSQRNGGFNPSSSGNSNGNSINGNGNDMQLCGGGFNNDFQFCNMFKDTEGNSAAQSALLQRVAEQRNAGSSGNGGGSGMGMSSPSGCPEDPNFMFDIQQAAAAAAAHRAKRASAA